MISFIKSSTLGLVPLLTLRHNNLIFCHVLDKLVNANRDLDKDKEKLSIKENITIQYNIMDIVGKNK